MKNIIAVVALGIGLAACADRGGMPAAEIQSMSDNGISVVYYDSISGMGNATQIAKAHCDPRGTEPVGSVAADGQAPNRTVVSFECK